MFFRAKFLFLTASRSFSRTSIRMGIQGLMKVLADEAPSSYKEGEMKNYFGRVVAIDASMSIYQFLIAVRSDGQNLTNEAGETTSHLMGMFYRTIRMLDHGIKPVYVFDGKPPPLKSGELKKRLERRAEAEKSLEQEKETGTTEAMEKFSRRTVRVTPQHNDECKQLLELMGIPYVTAPCEAEAQCAALCRAGKVYATASEDMDSLTFASTILLRHMTFSEARKEPIIEIYQDSVLKGLGMTHDEFIDLCILLGCDYCESIRGIGPKKAVEYIKKYKSIEEVLKHLDKKKYNVPEDWNYKGARELFKNPEVSDPETFNFKWEAPDEQKVVDFMVKEKGFNEDRIRSGVKKIIKSRGTGTQGRLDSFFGIQPGSTVVPVKRKAETSTAGGSNKKPKVGGATKGRPPASAAKGAKKGASSNLKRK